MCVPKRICIYNYNKPTITKYSMTEAQYFLLCEKYLQGLCTPKEIILLDAYQRDNELDKIDISDEDKSRIGEVLKNRIHESMNTSVRKPFYIGLWSWKTAAAIAAILLVTVYFAKNRFESEKLKTSLLAINKKSAQVNDILPGSINAVLTLSNGESITLDGSKNGVISKHGNTEISKSGNGLIVSANQSGKNLNNEILNKITIPRGGKYDVTLPDGTRVWLNSSSSLSFPTSFVGKEREVLLTGEAYFEVAKNKNKPFIVNVAGKQEVEVLGTHFNITAFDDDRDINTTLLEGSVKVKYNDTDVLIKPGQMAVNNFQKKLRVVDADIEEVMAWKNDMFIFNNENIASIMKKISRWYNVDVEFKGNTSGINFDGNYSRSKGLKSLLKNIELTDQVHFVIVERRITVIAK